MQVIVSIEDIDVSALSEFVFNHPNGNIFHTHEMFKVYDKTKKFEPVIVVVLDNTNEIIGVLVAVIQKEYSGVFGKITARSIIFGGPLIKNNNPDVLDFILKEYYKRIKGKAIYTQIRNQFDQKLLKNIFLKAEFEYEEHLNILIDLNKTEDILWKEVYTKRRNEIRRATKEGVTFKMQNTPDSLKVSYDILKEVYSRAKLPLPSFSHFKSLLANSNNNEGLRIGTAVYNDKIIGCMLVLVYNKTIYDYYAGSYALFYKKFPNHLIPWEIFKWGKANGYSQFDFGGAGKPNIPYGVREYKKKFGGEFVEFGRYIKVHKKMTFRIAKFGFLLWKKIIK